TSSGAGDENKLPVLDSSGKLATGFVDLTPSVLKTAYTAKGDVLVSSAASTPAVVPVGANTYVFTADSAQATGTKWAPISGAVTNFRTPVTVGNTTTKTTLLTTTILGGTLGTAGAIRGKV